MCCSPAYSGADPGIGERALLLRGMVGACTGAMNASSGIAVVMRQHQSPARRCSLHGLGLRAYWRMHGESITSQGAKENMLVNMCM